MARKSQVQIEIAPEIPEEDDPNYQVRLRMEERLGNERRGRAREVLSTKIHAFTWRAKPTFLKNPRLERFCPKLQ